MITENDFQKFAPPALTKVPEATTIAGNSYAWNDDLRAVHINDTSATVFGGFRRQLGFLKAGDVITVSFEAMYISGVPPKTALDYSLTDTFGTGSGTINYYASSGNVDIGFEKIEYTYTITKDAYYSVPFGTFTGDTGECYIRNCVVKCETSYSTEPKSVKQGFRTYYVEVLSGEFNVLTSSSNDFATLTVDSTNKKIDLTHEKPFKSGLGLPFIQENSVYGSPNYIFRSRSHTINGCIIEVYDFATNTKIDPSTVTDSVYFQMLFSGLDSEIEEI